MPQFLPGSTKTATLALTVSPSGVNCTAELYLTKDGVTKIATSGPIAFTSTGASQTVTPNIIMPTQADTYKAYLDIISAGVVVGAYQSTEDVLISVPAFTYEVTAAYICGLPQAPSWGTPGIGVRITNPTSQPITHVVYLVIAKVAGTAFNYSEGFSLTIPANAYVDWFFNDNAPNNPGYYKTSIGGDGIVNIWLEDDAGGISAVYQLPSQAFGVSSCTYLI